MTPLLPSIAAGVMALPIFFALLASFALFCALAALYASFRAAFGASEVHDVTSVEAESKRVLEERKKALLANLQDLEFDRRLDKIAEADFQRLDKKLRAQAKRVLKLLDEDVAPFRAKAADMIAAAVREETGEDGTPYRTPANEAGQVDESPEPLVCGECETVNDLDAAFCKKCGAKFDASISDESEAESKDGSEKGSNGDQSKPENNGESESENDESETHDASENDDENENAGESENQDESESENESEERPGGAR